MDNFENINLSKQELKILKIMQYHHANISELHGYLIFPGYETVLVAIHNLEVEYNLISKEIDNDRYYTNDTGKKYIKYLKRKKRYTFFRTIGSIITALAAIATILQVVK